MSNIQVFLLLLGPAIIGLLIVGVSWLREWRKIKAQRERHQRHLKNLAALKAESEVYLNAMKRSVR